MKWALLIVGILIFSMLETYLSIRVYKKQVDAGTYQQNKTKIILLRLTAYSIFYLIAGMIYAFS